MVVIWALFLAPAVVTARKGHIAFFLVGFVTTGITWLVGTVRLAKPNSPWARHRYDVEKMRRSRERYPRTDPDEDSRAMLVMYLVFGPMAAALVAGFVVGRF